MVLNNLPLLVVPTKEVKAIVKIGFSPLEGHWRTPMKPILCILTLLIAVPCAAQSKAVVVTGLQPGTYIMQVDASGAVSVSPIQVVTVGGGPVVPPVVPVDPVTPVDPDLSPDAAAIKAAAQAATADPTRAETAGNLAEVMKMVKAQVDSRTLTTYSQIAAATNWLMDSIIGKQTTAWKPTKDLIGQRLAALGQQGAQPEEYSGFFADAADGFEASIPLQDDDELQAIEDGLLQEPQKIDIATLMKLFEFFMKYILPFIIK